jgi:hypothetical protein
VIAALSEDAIIETFVSNVVILATADCGLMQHHSLIVYSVLSPVPAHFWLSHRMRHYTAELSPEWVCIVQKMVTALCVALLAILKIYQCF